MFSIETLKALAPMLFQGLKITLIVAIAGICLACVIGTIAGLALASQNKVFKTLANVYLWVIRGIPFVVQALYVYFVIPDLIGIELSSLSAGIITMAIYGGAFISEIVRGAVESVDLGQREAGDSLGFTRMQTTVYLIAPLAIRTALPALGNQFIMSIKDTSLLTVIVVKEMTQEAMNYAALSYNFVETYTILAVFYLAIISVLTIGLKVIENNFRTSRAD